MRNVVGPVIQAFLGGAVIAVIATVVHGESFPFVLAACLAVVAMYLVSLRLLTDERLVTIAGAVGVIVTVLVLAQRSIGGSVLIAANDAGNYWVIGVSLIAGIASSWPSFPTRSAR